MVAWEGSRLHDRKRLGSLAMTSKGRHPKKEIADALTRCRDAGLVVEEIHRAHRWGRVVCPGCGEHYRVWSTPRVPEDEARRLRRFADRHRDHVTSEED
jgi:hypothetical protein